MAFSKEFGAKWDMLGLGNCAIHSKKECRNIEELMRDIPGPDGTASTKVTIAVITTATLVFSIASTLVSVS